jgi:hypothetical protein
LNDFCNSSPKNDNSSPELHGDDFFCYDIVCEVKGNEEKRETQISYLSERVLDGSNRMEEAKARVVVLHIDRGSGSVFESAPAVSCTGGACARGRAGTDAAAVVDDRHIYRRTVSG